MFEIGFSEIRMGLYDWKGALNHHDESLPTSGPEIEDYSQGRIYPIGYISLSLEPQDPRGPPTNYGTHRVMQWPVYDHSD